MRATWAEIIEADLKNKPASYAADFLRDALADDEPGTLIVAMLRAKPSQSKRANR